MVPALVLLWAPLTRGESDATPQLGPPPQYLERPAAPSVVAPMVPLVEGPGIAVDTTNRSNVVAFFNNVYLPSTNVPIGWTGSISGCVPGTTGQAYTDATVQRVNYYRAMAGLPANIVLNTSLTDLGLTPSTEDQSAALMMSAQNALSHAPPTNWACYTALGAQAAGKSNIALGAAGADAVALYMEDPGQTNSFVGHRRWLLYPPQTAIGTGSVAFTSSSPPALAANALWVIPTAEIATWGARPVTPNGVAWPPPGFVPYQIMPSSRWSFSYGEGASSNPSFAADFSGAAVSMSQGAVNVPVTLEAQNNNVGFGDNTLVWRPQGIVTTASAPDITYTVTISNVRIGGVPRQFTYAVTVIDPGRYPSIEAQARTDITTFATTHGFGTEVPGWFGSIPNWGDVWNLYWDLFTGPGGYIVIYQITYVADPRFRFLTTYDFTSFSGWTAAP